MIDWDISSYPQFMANPLMQKNFNRGGPDLTQLLEMQMLGKVDSWAIRFCYAQFITDTYCITPVKTLVRNIGLDNSGVHCGVDPRREHQSLDNSWLPKKFAPARFLNKRILELYRVAFGPTPPSSRLFQKIKNVIHRYM